MKVNKSIGEVGIRAGERDYLLRPSFYALSQLGSPTEIVRKFRAITQTFECLNGWRRFPHGVDQLAAFPLARDIIDACLVKGDAHALTGHVVWYEGRGMRHKPAAIPYNDLIVLAFHLMRYGIYGNPKPRKNQEGESQELTEFDPAEAVGMAVGQFGMNLSDAWNLTMIEYQRAWDGKYPEQDDTKDQQRISDDEYKELMEWHDQVRAAQKKAAKA